jgi:hypothetical protein
MMKCMFAVGLDLDGEPAQFEVVFGPGCGQRTLSVDKGTRTIYAEMD